LALVNDEPRAATVLSKDFCQLVYIDRTDFNRIVKFSYEKEIKEKILFLKKFPLLADFNLSALKSVAQVMEWKKFQPGEYVLKEGDRSKNLCIIRNGEAVVTRTTKIPEKDNTIQVVIGRLGRYDYFGEEGVYALDSDPLNLVSDQIASSIIAAKNIKELEIGVIGSFDAKNKITNIPRNSVHVKSIGEIIKMYYESRLKKKWDKQKKIFFDKLLQEKFSDPNINTEKFKKIKKKKRNWI
jgi:CRP-like cAMP-binding protein